MHKCVNVNVKSGMLFAYFFKLLIFFSKYDAPTQSKITSTPTTKIELRGKNDEEKM